MKWRWSVVVTLKGETPARMVISSRVPRNEFHERKAREMAAIYRKINPGAIIAIEWERSPNAR
jgi:hypothetical protein